MRVGAASYLAVSLFVSLAPCASHATTLFGLLDTGELYKSTDQGLNWTAVSTLPVRDAVALGAGVNSAELYLASRSGGEEHRVKVVVMR